MEMGNPNHPNPHLRMSMPESYYEKKLQEERVASQNMARKMIASKLQEGVLEQFQMNNDRN